MGFRWMMEYMMEAGLWVRGWLALLACQALFGYTGDSFTGILGWEGLACVILGMGVYGLNCSYSVIEGVFTSDSGGDSQLLLRIDQVLSSYDIGLGKTSKRFLVI